MSAPAKPEIASVSWVDGYGREYHLVPKAELDAANATADQLAADCDSLTEGRDYWKHLAEERQVDLDAAHRDADRAYAYGYGKRKGGLPTPDVANIDHGDFVRDWLGQVTDEQLGERPDLSPEQQDSHLASRRGALARDAVLNTIGRIEGLYGEAGADEKLISHVADICETAAQGLLTALGDYLDTTVDLAAIDWRSTATGVLREHGLLKDDA